MRELLYNAVRWYNVSNEKFYYVCMLKTKVFTTFAGEKAEILRR